MISPELLRRYPFFAGLSHENIVTLADTAQEVAAEEGHYFFHEGATVHEMFLVLEGAVGIVLELPSKQADHAVSEQFTRDMTMEDVVVSAVGPGDVFGWSGLVAPHETMAGAKALTPCRVVAFDCQKLIEEHFKADCSFGFVMMQKTAQVIRQRLRDVRMEALGQLVAA